MALRRTGRTQSPRRRRAAAAPATGPGFAPTTLAGFQAQIEALYGRRDRSRGLAETFMWFAEEVGELSRALRRGGKRRRNLAEEFADVLAWLVTLASIAGIDMEAASRKYASGCPRCGRTPCGCRRRGARNVT
jgi:NTP pyrophosphatase (non-canonical NTP hydrolase)